jgi:CDP-diacylglycerol--glycerol-3-phosphate 3-phosphatidyltransferase
MNRIKVFFRRIIVDPVVRILVKCGIHPNVITVSTLFLAAGAFVFYYRGVFWAGAIFFFFCGIFDTFDGEIARRTNRVSRVGGFLDSTIDRINEFIVYLGLFFYYYQRQSWVLFWIFAALFGSIMVSYTRARAEGLGANAQVGIFERFTRILLLIIGSVLGPKIMVYVLIILSVGTMTTTLRRIYHVYRQNHQGPVDR